MRGQAGFFDVDERLKQLSAKGDSLERLNAVVDFELFRADLERAGRRSDRAKGGVSVHAGGGVFGSLGSVGMGVVEVAIGPGGKVELRDFNLNRERTR